MIVRKREIIYKNCMSSCFILLLVRMFCNEMTCQEFSRIKGSLTLFSLPRNSKYNLIKIQIFISIVWTSEEILLFGALLLFVWKSIYSKYIQGILARCLYHNRFRQCWCHSVANNADERRMKEKCWHMIFIRLQQK